MKDFFKNCYSPIFLMALVVLIMFFAPLWGIPKLFMAKVSSIAVILTFFWMIYTTKR